MTARPAVNNTVTAEKIVIATGTRPARPSQVEFDGDRVLDSDSVLSSSRCPTPWSWSAPA